MVRAELRPVVIKAGPRLQVVTTDGVRPYTRNVGWGDEAATAVDALLAEPFANWRLETTTAVLEVRITKRGNASIPHPLRRRIVVGVDTHKHARVAVAWTRSEG